MSSMKKGKEHSGRNRRNEKRVDPPLLLDYSSQFRKDWAEIRMAGRQDLRRVRSGMVLLSENEGPLPADFKDHQLNGKWSDFREFHAGGDLLVIYRQKGDTLFFVRVGTHAELFE